MGKPYKKGICEKCGRYGYVNEHHITPLSVKRKKNNKKVTLYLDCHIEIHEILPDEPQEPSFYEDKKSYCLSRPPMIPNSLPKISLMTWKGALSKSSSKTELMERLLRCSQRKASFLSMLKPMKRESLA